MIVAWSMAPVNTADGKRTMAAHYQCWHGTVSLVKLASQQLSWRRQQQHHGQKQVMLLLRVCGHDPCFENKTINLFYSFSQVKTPHNACSSRRRFNALN